MGGKGSGRKAQSKPKAPRPETRPCEQCGRLMYIGRAGRKKYCSLKCKQAAYRRRQKTDQEQPAAVQEA